MSIPSDVFKMLSLVESAIPSQSPAKDECISHYTRNNNRKRYTLNELLQGVTPKNMKYLNKKTERTRNGELIRNEKI